MRKLTERLSKMCRSVSIVGTDVIGDDCITCSDMHRLGGRSFKADAMFVEEDYYPDIVNIRTRFIWKIKVEKGENMFMIGIEFPGERI